MTSLTGEAVCCAPTGDRCGEGVLWHPGEQAVYWTDIPRFLIHRFDPATASVKSWFFDEPVTAVLRTRSMFWPCLGSRVILWEPATDARRDHGFMLPEWPTVRINDAGVDPRGSLWVGLHVQQRERPMDRRARQAARTESCSELIPTVRPPSWKTDIGISNTFVWSPDQKALLFRRYPGQYHLVI